MRRIKRGDKFKHRQSGDIYKFNGMLYLETDYYLYTNITKKQLERFIETSKFQYIEPSLTWWEKLILKLLKYGK